MDHPCHRCGTAVEDGVPFCPQCNAPQIRVAATSPEPQSVPVTLEGQEAQSTPSPVTSQATPIQWSQALPSAALAGLVAAGMMVIPLGAFGLGMLAAGALSVTLYRRRHPASNFTSGMGARLGAVSGAVGFCIFSLFSALAMLVSGSGGKVRAAMLDAIQQSLARTADPQAQEMLERLKTPAGLALMMALFLAFLLVSFLLFSSLGGALAAFLLRRKERQ